MAERFFSNQTYLSMSDSEIDHHPIILLSGPPSSGKTSLLFQFAYNSALQTNSFVVFICNRRRLQSKPPFLSQGIDPSSDVFSLVRMKYVDDYEGITKYFAAFHMHNPLPSAVVIDDFGDFFDDRNCQAKYNNSPRGKELGIVRGLALCHNAITHANETGPCKLLLSDTHDGDSMRLLYIYKRWVSSIYTIRGDGCGSFYLNRHDGAGISSKSEKVMGSAKYSIALQYLVFEEDDDGCHFWCFPQIGDSKFPWPNFASSPLTCEHQCGLLMRKYIDYP